MFYPVRPGNRGGRDLFKWDDVRYMKYNDREQYLGVTVRAGFLDKGGKWRKGDWYLKEKVNSQNQEILKEKLEFQMQDEKRIRQALGLEEREAIDEGPKLTKYEIEEITRKNEMEVNEDDPTNALGLGFKLNEKAIMSQKLGNDPKVNYNRLEGEGVLGINENDKKFNGKNQQLNKTSEYLQQNIETPSEQEKRKRKKEKKKTDSKDQMTKEEKQKYIEQLNNEIQLLKQKKEQKQQEEKEKQLVKEKEEKERKEKERRERKKSEHKHRRHSRSRSNSRNKHRHHKR